MHSTLFFNETVKRFDQCESVKARPEFHIIINVNYIYDHVSDLMQRLSFQLNT